MSFDKINKALMRNSIEKIELNEQKFDIIFLMETIF